MLEFELTLLDTVVTPERLSTPAFKKRLQVIYKQGELIRLVVDEAHCISECKLYNLPSRLNKVLMLYYFSRGTRFQVSVTLDSQSLSLAELTVFSHIIRPEYSKIGHFRADYPRIPIMALTASATPTIQDDM